MKTMNKKVLVAALLMVSIIISLFAVLNFSAEEEAALVSIQPPAQTIEPFQIFAVDVLVEGITPTQPLDSFKITVEFDPSLVEAISIVIGPFVPLVDKHLWWEHIDNVNGSVQFSTDPPNDAWVSGSGIIATIEFRCRKNGDALINFYLLGSRLLDPGWGQIPAEFSSGWVYQKYPTAHVYIDPPVYTVPNCVPFKVHVKVTGVTNLARYFMDLTFTNTAVIDALDIVDGCFLLDPKWETSKFILDDDGTGKGWIGFRYESGVVATGASGAGTLATITFHCTGAGESILNITSISLYDPAGNKIPCTTATGTVIQAEYWEPVKLIDIVEWPYPYTLVDIPFVPPASPEGYPEVMAELENKGYAFDPADGTAVEVTMFIEGEEHHGTATSLWSNDTLEDGTRACMLSLEMDDGTGMAMGFVTNLLAPEQVPEVDPYIIVNAQPYIFVDFYWWAWTPIGKVVKWSYWWYDSHSHPNWFWSPYWWWRTYTKTYYYPYIDVPYWRPSWGWWWHWTYWRHWYWWSTYFPYDP